MARTSRRGGKAVDASYMYYTYVLKSKTSGKYYIGQCNNLESRLKRHNSGRNKSTKSGIPWNLIYKEEFTNRSEAMRRENKIKSYKGGEGFKKLIFGV